MRISFIFIVVLSLISPITYAASIEQSVSEITVPKPKNVWMIIKITTFPDLNSASAFQVPRLHWSSREFCQARLVASLQDNEVLSKKNGEFLVRSDSEFSPSYKQCVEITVWPDDL